MEAPFVPSGFIVPLALATEEFRLEPLGPQHNESDYEAWSSSVEHIQTTPGWETSSWPDDRSLADNLRDLERHADDFENRSGFTFTVLDPATGDVIGCVYIYPDKSEQHDARVSSWVQASRPELDVAAVAGGHRLAGGRVAVRACGLRRACRRLTLRAFPYSFRARSLRASSLAARPAAKSSLRPRLVLTRSKSPLTIHSTTVVIPAGRQLNRQL